MALLWWIIPAQVNDRGSFGLPPSLAPRALAWVMVLCGTVLALQNTRTPAQPGTGLNLKDIVFLAACVTAVGVMLMAMQAVSGWIGRPYAGFLCVAPLALIAFTALHGRAPIWVYAFNAVAVPALVYVTFWWGLRLPLP